MVAARWLIFISAYAARHRVKNIDIYNTEEILPLSDWKWPHS